MLAFDSFSHAYTYTYFLQVEAVTRESAMTEVDQRTTSRQRAKNICILGNRRFRKGGRKQRNEEVRTSLWKSVKSVFDFKCERKKLHELLKSPKLGIIKC